MPSNVCQQSFPERFGISGTMPHKLNNSFRGVQAVVRRHCFIHTIRAQQEQVARLNHTFDNLVLKVFHDTDRNPDRVRTKRLQFTIGSTNQWCIVSGICQRNPMRFQIDDSQRVSDETAGSHVMTHMAIDAFDRHRHIVGEGHGVLYDAGNTGHDQGAGDAFSRDIPVTVMFEHTSIARLAEYLRADAGEEAARRKQETEELDQARDVLLKTRNRLRSLEES